MSEYEPELGQALFGQPCQEYDGGNLLQAAIHSLEHELNRVMWNRLQEEYDSPFSNTGATFDTEGLSIRAYSWADDEQPWNLKCGDVEISWYKHAWRGLSVNRPMTAEQIGAFLDEALAILHRCDSGHGYGEHPVGAPFYYHGKLYEDERGKEMLAYMELHKGDEGRAK